MWVTTIFLLLFFRGTVLFLFYFTCGMQNNCTSGYIFSINLQYHKLVLLIGILLVNTHFFTMSPTYLGWVTVVFFIRTNNFHSTPYSIQPEPVLEVTPLTENASRQI